jgi:ribosomal protein L12E/L44/L45/RPP1/RPP2
MAGRQQLETLNVLSLDQDNTVRATPKDTTIIITLSSKKTDQILTTILRKTDQILTTILRLVEENPHKKIVFTHVDHDPEVHITFADLFLSPKLDLKEKLKNVKIDFYLHNCSSPDRRLQNNFYHTLQVNAGKLSFNKTGNVALEKRQRFDLIMNNLKPINAKNFLAALEKTAQPPAPDADQAQPAAAAAASERKAPPRLPTRQVPPPPASVAAADFTSLFSFPLSIHLDHRYTQKVTSFIASNPKPTAETKEKLGQLLIEMPKDSLEQLILCKNGNIRVDKTLLTVLSEAYPDFDIKEILSQATTNYSRQASAARTPPATDTTDRAAAATAAQPSAASATTAAPRKRNYLTDEVQKIVQEFMNKNPKATNETKTKLGVFLLNISPDFLSLYMKSSTGNQELEQTLLNTLSKFYPGFDITGITSQAISDHFSQRSAAAAPQRSAAATAAASSTTTPQRSAAAAPQRSAAATAAASSTTTPQRSAAAAPQPAAAPGNRTLNAIKKILTRKVPTAAAAPQGSAAASSATTPQRSAAAAPQPAAAPGNGALNTLKNIFTKKVPKSDAASQKSATDTTDRAAAAPQGSATATAAAPQGSATATAAAPQRSAAVSIAAAAVDEEFLNPMRTQASRKTTVGAHSPQNPAAIGSLNELIAKNLMDNKSLFIDIFANVSQDPTAAQIRYNKLLRESGLTENNWGKTLHVGDGYLETVSDYLEGLYLHKNPTPSTRFQVKPSLAASGVFNINKNLFTKKEPKSAAAAAPQGSAAATAAAAAAPRAAATPQRSTAAAAPRLNPFETTAPSSRSAPVAAAADTGSPQETYLEPDKAYLLGNLFKSHNTQKIKGNEQTEFDKFFTKNHFTAADFSSTCYFSREEKRPVIDKIKEMLAAQGLTHLRINIPKAASSAASKPVGLNP